MLKKISESRCGMFKVSFTPYNGESNNFLGYCNLVADDKYRMTSISVLRSDTADNGFFLSMPAYFTGRKDENDKPVFKDYFYPLDSDFRKELNEAVKKTMELGEPVEFCRDEPVSFNVKVKPKENSNDSDSKASVTVYLSRGLPDKKADMVIDSYHIREVLSGEKAGNLFIAAPSKKNKAGDYNDICFPTTKEFRDELLRSIMKSYENEISKNAGTMKISDANASDIITK